MKTRSRRGFTLLELIMALGLMALVLVAMNSFLFSMGELWGRQSDTRLFQLHVRSVARALQKELTAASLPRAGGASTFAVKELRLRDGRNDPVFTFSLPSDSRLLPWPGGRALPDVEAGLVQRERAGLVLLWHSRVEERFEDDPPREAVLTPWVTAIEWDYWEEDFKNWKTERQLRRDLRGENPVPRRLRLTFTYRGQTELAVIDLPSVKGGVSQP